MTVAEMLERMSSVELTRWMIVYEKEHFGSDVDYLGHAITAREVYSSNLKPGTKRPPLEDFMPKFEKKKKQSVGSMLQIASMFTHAAGGEDNR